MLSSPGSSCASTAVPSGLVATCALDGSIKFSTFARGVPALGQSGLRLSAAGVLGSEALVGPGFAKAAPEDIAWVRQRSAFSSFFVVFVLPSLWKIVLSCIL